MTPTGKIRAIRWVPWWRRKTVVQPWTCLCVIAATPNCATLAATASSQRANVWSRRFRRGPLGSRATEGRPKPGSSTAGIVRVWYGIGAADLQQPLPASQVWDCWGPLVSLSRLVVDGPAAHPRYAYRLSRQWRNRFPGHS